MGTSSRSFRAVDFERFRPELEAALSYSDGSRGGRPPFDPVRMCKILVIQTINALSDERTEYLINDRFSFMRFLGLGFSDHVPDAKTIWLFRERLTKAGAIASLFERFGWMLREAGCIPMSGRIVDASLVAAPRQRNTNVEKAEIKAGRVPERWEDQPAATEFAIPAFGYKSHISIDRCFRLLRRWKATDASAHDGARLREGLLDRSNTGSAVWVDPALSIGGKREPHTTPWLRFEGPPQESAEPGDADLDPARQRRKIGETIANRMYCSLPACIEQQHRGAEGSARMDEIFSRNA